MQESEAGMLDQEDYSYHEEGLATQESFRKYTVSLINSIKSIGNPFLDIGPELLNIDSHDVLPDDVVETVWTIENLRKQQYNDYMESVLVKGTKSVHEAIKRSSL